MIPECFPQGEVALDITEGKLFSEGNLGRDSVPTRRLSMRKIKEVLRLRYELGLGQRQIARVARSVTVRFMST